MEARNQYDHTVINVCKFIIRFLMAILTLCIILGSVDLIRVIWKDISTTTIDPVTKAVISPIGFLNLKALLSTFQLVLILAVGFELVKSLHTLIASKVIPSLPLVQIAIIALANKMITIDFKEAGYQKVIGMAAVMMSLGATYYFLRKSDADAGDSHPTTQHDQKQEESKH